MKTRVIARGRPFASSSPWRDALESWCNWSRRTDTGLQKLRVKEYSHKRIQHGGRTLVELGGQCLRMGHVLSPFQSMLAKGPSSSRAAALLSCSEVSNECDTHTSNLVKHNFT